MTDTTETLPSWKRRAKQRREKRRAARQGGSFERAYIPPTLTVILKALAAAEAEVKDLRQKVASEKANQRKRLDERAEAAVEVLARTPNIDWSAYRRLK